MSPTAPPMLRHFSKRSIISRTQPQKIGPAYTSTSRGGRER